MPPVTCPNCKHEFEPLVLDGPKKRGKTKQTFAAWIKSLNGDPPIPADHHALRYADAAKIPREFVALAFEAFARQYRPTSRQQSDWPAHFRKALEGNWGKVWFLNDDGKYVLSTVGKQLQMTMRRPA